jgi:CheY-like chemotaxis protein
MGLECLGVTSDLTLLGQIRSSLGARVSFDFRQDSTSAIELASRRHLDGLVIDCDDIAGGTQAVTKVRNSHSNKHTLIVAVVHGVTSLGGALDLGANFVLSKPIQEARLRSVFDFAVPRMEREHRRYFRYNIDLPVRFRNHHGQSFAARMKNLSEGGLAIKPVDPMKLGGVVNVEFDVPSVAPEAFRAKADVVWSDAFSMGLRFLYIEKDSGVALQAWLASLEAQCQFRESTQHLH